MNFIDLFSGAGGLSEGFIRAGFNPVAHVEIDKAACNTLITRTAYHHLKKSKNLQPYIDYIQNKISRVELYSLIPKNKKESVINMTIGDKNNQIIFDKIDSLKGEKPIDLIIGGP
ncbi:MAG: DNA cytosine methyltransferase, partial [Bacteroidales bacterium]|nr:DNA cytosine methyltransferase [Bacteroidales bacterium]